MKDYHDFLAEDIDPRRQIAGTHKPSLGNRSAGIMPEKKFC